MGLTGLPSIKKYVCNSVDYTFNLVGGLIFLIFSLVFLTIFGTFRITFFLKLGKDDLMNFLLLAKFFYFPFEIVNFCLEILECCWFG